VSGGRFDAVAFDIDGTLYPNRRFYRKLVPFALTHLALLAAFRDARNALRAAGFEGDFYAEQLRLIAGALKKDPALIKKTLERHIYGEWQQHFKHIRPYPDVRAAVSALRDAGLKTGVLSDFPIGRKLEFLGLAGLWDAALCSEELGALKPAPLPFARLAETLGCAPGRILYVGNSVGCDVAGAKKAGMAAALLCRLPPCISSHKENGGADFVFSAYRQLPPFVLH
jgi:putative hydrolase of the HAD superfamily